MIFYFSGTGNSLQAAKSISDYSGEALISIAERINSGEKIFEYNLKENETIGFVFPVYAWGPPGMVLDFIEKLKLNDYNNNYVFSVATCGANIGNTMKFLDKRLSDKGLKLCSAFSVVMPNNYIIIGDVDTKEVEKEKPEKAEKEIQEIIRVIDRREAGVFKLTKGFLPIITTGVINSLFNKYALSTGQFYADDKCTGCGICERVCNTKTIKVDSKPQWGDKCTQCLACINYCPVRAIQYGKGTKNKGRYKNPKVSISI